MITYRGFRIVRTRYQGCTCYWAHEFGANYLASSLRTMKRWIDCAIAERRR